jgi:hypothetical protein
MTEAPDSAISGLDETSHMPQDFFSVFIHKDPRAMCIYVRMYGKRYVNLFSRGVVLVLLFVPGGKVIM